MTIIFRFILLFLFSSNLAFAMTPIKRVYVFGDSYSDFGRASAGKDGPTAVVYMAQDFGIDLVPYKGPGPNDRSLNFAVGGAKTGDDLGHPIGGGQIAAVGMKTQVSEFEKMVQSGDIRFDPQTTLFFIAGGLNDRSVPTKETFDNLEQEIATLYALGGRHFRLAILPVLIPRFAPVGERLNPSLRLIPLDMKRKYKNMEIENIEWGKYFDLVLQNASSYGFTNSKDQCLVQNPLGGSATQCASPKSYFYYEVNHPSTAVHKIVGDMLFKDLNNSN